MRLGDTVLKRLLLDARTHRAWLPKEVSDSQLKEVVDLMKMGPTSYNCLPARIGSARTTRCTGKRMTWFCSPASTRASKRSIEPDGRSSGS